MQTKKKYPSNGRKRVMLTGTICWLGFLPRISNLSALFKLFMLRSRLFGLPYYVNLGAFICLFCHKTCSEAVPLRNLTFFSICTVLVGAACVIFLTSNLVFDAFS